MSDQDRKDPGPGQDDQYLWDGTGTPDPIVARLEDVLRPLAHGELRSPRRSGRGARWIVAAAVAVVLAVFAWSQTKDAGPFFQVLDSEGRVVAKLRPGDEHTAAEEEKIQLSTSCEILPDAETVLRVERLDDSQARLYLQLGKLDVYIDGTVPARFFQVRTPATRCVDLGCRYTIEVAADGTTDVEVVLGKVALEGRGRSVFLPMDAKCRATMSRGAGVPYLLERTPPFLISALAGIDGLDEGAERQKRVSDLLGRITTGKGADFSFLGWQLMNDRDAVVRAMAEAWLIDQYGKPSKLDGTRDPAVRRELFRRRLEGDW